MKSARLMLGIVCGAMCIALFSGCETQQSACEREKRLTERLDEMQMELDGRINGVNMEMAGMRSNPPVVVQQVPTPMPMPDYNMASAVTTTQPASLPVETISIEDSFYSQSKADQLRQLAASSAESQIYDTPKPKSSGGGQSLASKHIRVPVPVRTVQAALKEAGFYNGAVDGKVGRQTIAAITAFQRSVGLKADGVCGRQTWAQLQGYVPAGMSTRRLK